MPVIGSRWFLIALCGALIAGCGGGGSTAGGGGGNGGGGNGGGGNGGGGGGNGGGGGSSNPTTVTLTFPNSVTLAAAQIGSGAFTVQTLSGNQLSLSIPSGTANYAVAYLCPGQSSWQGLFTEEVVWEASTADGTSANLSCMDNFVSTAGMSILTGSLDASAIPGAENFTIFALSGNSIFADDSSGPTANFSTLAPTGNDRVLVLVGDSYFQTTLAVKNFGSQTVPGALNGGNSVVFSAADEPTPTAITYNNEPSGFGSPGTSVSLQTAGNGFSFEIAAPAKTTTQYPMLPAAATESGDFYSFTAIASTTGSNPSSVYAGSANSGGPISLTFPAPWTYAGPTAAAQPTFNFGYTGFSGKSGVLQEATYSWQVGTSGSTALFDEIRLTATAAYQGGSTALAVPDLSGVTGFLSTPASGKNVNWSAQVWQYSYGVEGALTLNSTWSGVENSGSYTVP